MSLFYRGGVCSEVGKKLRETISTPTQSCMSFGSESKACTAFRAEQAASNGNAPALDVEIMDLDTMATAGVTGQARWFLTPLDGKPAGL